jgi:hypothetical protein
MADEKNRTPDNQQPPEDETANDGANITPPEDDAQTPPADQAQDADRDEDGMADRLERLGGEPAPAISPEEFARLQQSGQIHIDSRGRVQTQRREKTDAGMSLRKRRAWY